MRRQPDPAEQDSATSVTAPDRRRQRLVLTATVLASAMAFIDGTVVTIALPAIQENLRAGFDQLQWVVNAYTLMLGALLLIGGSLGDRIGRKRVFVTGIAIFAAASIACALAPGAAVLIGARAAQGVGAALLVPQSLAILSATFPRAVRGRAIGTWAAASAIATALGPPLGGFLIDLLSWRAAFWINVPLSAAALWLTWRFVPESRDPAASGPLDWIGSGLAMVGLAALIYGLTGSSGVDRAPLAVGAMLVGAAGLAAFWLWERSAENPVMPLSMFRSRPFLAANILTLFLYGALTGVLFLLPFDLIERRGLPASAVGTTLLPFGLIIGLLSRRAGALADRYGAKPFLVCGSLVVAAAIGMLALNLPNYWLGVLVPVLLMALGMAAVVSPLTTIVMNSAPDAQSGAASGINNAASRIAGLFAVAVLGLAADLIFGWGGASPDARFGVLPDLSDPARNALEVAFVAAYSGALAFAALWGLIAAVAALLWLRAEDGTIHARAP